MNNKEYYLNSASTTKVDPDVAEVIYRTINKNWANPSDLYKSGRESMSIIEDAQDVIKDYLRANDGDKIIFTGSGSEANNLALTGWSKALDRRIVCATPIEHKSIVAQPCIQWNIAVDEVGRVDLEFLKTLARTLSRSYYEIMFSVGLVNNEIGTVQDIAEISKIIHEYKNCYLHVDATQGFAHCGVSVDGIDLLSASFHKIGVPKGIGMLYVRDGIDLSPVIYGGQQMYGLRAGTENVPYIAGVACKFRKLRHYHNPYYWEPRDREIAKTTADLMQKLLQIPGSRLNGPIDNRVLGNINISFTDIEGSTLALMLDTDGIYISSGSACNSQSVDPSHVLKAIKTPEEYQYGAIRITIDEPLSEEEVNYIAGRIQHWVYTLRRIHSEEEGE
ncbi:MAG: cysteine desulfurase [Lachnospiraceae bacterium]|nr:cysteine desulfurase [Lachnospiraceae bacterium]MBQ6482749.1 cysteine desulfurase [Anaerolineaceae bacterium]